MDVVNAGREVSDGVLVPTLSPFPIGVMGAGRRMWGAVGDDKVGFAGFMRDCRLAARRDCFFLFGI